MKNAIVILSLILGFLTSCQKEEPIEPPAYKKINQPPTSNIPSFANTTWVLYKFQLKLDNVITQPELVSDTLKFVGNSELFYNGLKCEYSFYPSGNSWYIELKDTPTFFGSINSSVSEGAINYGELIQVFNNMDTNQKWIIWMRKI